MSINFIILGCGSSMGVPRIDGFFGKCNSKEKKNYIDDYEEYDDLDLVACYWDIDEAFSTMYKKINQDVKFEFRYSIKPVHICMDDAENLFLKEIKDTNSKINIDNILVLLDKKRLYC